MNLRGGTVFIMAGDRLPRVDILDAEIVLETAAGSLLGAVDFLSSRVVSGSSFITCHIMTLEYWAEQQARELLTRIAAKP